MASPEAPWVGQVRQRVSPSLQGAGKTPGGAEPHALPRARRAGHAVPQECTPLSPTLRAACPFSRCPRPGSKQARAEKRLSRAHSQTAVPASLASEQLNHTGDSVGALRPAGTLVGPRRVKVHREGAGRGPGRGRALPRPSLGSCTAGPPAGTPGRDQALVTAGHGGRGGGHLLGIWQGRRVQCGVSASTAVCRQ